MRFFHNQELIDWEKHFKILYPMLFQLAKRLTANSDEAHDIVMESIRKMLEMKSPDLKDFDAVKGYLIICVKHACISYLRKQKVKDSEEMNAITDDECPLIEFIDAEIVLTALKEAIKAEVNRQPPQRRKVLILYYYKNKKIEEISSLLHISPRTVNNVLTKGRKILRKKFGNMDIWSL